MLYALICNDKPSHLQVRTDNRPAHQAYLGDLRDKGVLKMAGPLLDDNEEPHGSLIIVEAADRDEAQGLADKDPFTAAGLFESIEIRPFRWVFNPPES